MARRAAAGKHRTPHVRHAFLHDTLEYMSDRPPDIEAPRLRLIALLPNELRALVLGDSGQASTLVGVAFPPSWPTEGEARAALPWHLDALKRNPRHLGWRVRVVVSRESGSVVGSMSLKGPPSRGGDIEVGWGIDESHRHLGYAFEAATALLRWASGEPRVVSVSATINPGNLASQRLAAKLGLTLTGQLRRGLPLWSVTLGAAS
jgi:ribosomal-protein-alanine N-acetyltransferase